MFSAKQFAESLEKMRDQPPGPIEERFLKETLPPDLAKEWRCCLMSKESMTNLINLLKEHG